jgi:hypothetical protein
MSNCFDESSELIALSSIFSDILTIHSDPVRVIVSMRCGKEPVVATFFRRVEPVEPICSGRNSIIQGPGPTTCQWDFELEGFRRGSAPRVAQRLAAVQKDSACTEAPLFALVTEFQAAVEELGPTPGSPALPAPLLHVRETVTEIPVIHGPETVVMKSTFQAHIARVISTAQVNSFLEHLLQDSKIAKATHNIRAYRIRSVTLGGASVVLADNDDDGEDAAGARLAHLLDIMAADNLCVVVSRCFGGVLMGPSRFKAILEVAREAIEGAAKQAGWYTRRPH